MWYPPWWGTYQVLSSDRCNSDTGTFSQIPCPLGGAWTGSSLYEIVGSVRVSFLSILDAEEGETCCLEVMDGVREMEVE